MTHKDTATGQSVNSQLRIQTICRVYAQIRNHPQWTHRICYSFKQLVFLSNLYGSIFLIFVSFRYFSLLLYTYSAVIALSVAFLLITVTCTLCDKFFFLCQLLLQSAVFLCELCGECSVFCFFTHYFFLRTLW